MLAQVLSAATLDVPDVAPLAGGRPAGTAVHTEAMGYLLAELQSVARAPTRRRRGDGGRRAAERRAVTW